MGARVNVDGDQGLRFIDDDFTARRQGDATLEGLLNLALDVVAFENGDGLFIIGDLAAGAGGDLRDKFLGALFAGFGNFFGNDGRVAASVLSWVTLIVLNVFMARAGLSQGKPWLVNLAIAFLALNLFTRYFDIFSSMLNQGMMFLVSGAVILGLGWYLERKRRALLGMIRAGGDA